MSKIKIKNGSKHSINGWIYVTIKGKPYERGLAHGKLLKHELKEIINMLEFNCLQNYGYSYETLKHLIYDVFSPQIKQNFNEFYNEMEGIAYGSSTSIEDIVFWNCYVSLDSVLGGLDEILNNNPLLDEKYGHIFSSGSSSNPGKMMRGEGMRMRISDKNIGQDDRCTAFMAVGSYTSDGKIVCAHNSFDNFIDGQYFNVVLNIKGANGSNSANILMQTSPGCISSGTDFYVTSHGLLCTETTIGGFNKFRLGDPICCRIRNAMQYGKTLDDCVEMLTKNNSGDYANSWLIGDIKTNTIMRIELGLNYVNVEKKKDGYFIGYNAPEDPRIRNLECSNTGYDDIRRHQGARRVRLTQLMEEHKGKLTPELGKEILADHYDVYLNKINPCSRTCCSHYELDDRAFMSQADRPKPYQPRGALDGIVSSTSMAKVMSFEARWGSSCGTPFDKTTFCKQHIQWADQEPYLHDRPNQPWTEFNMHKSSSSNKPTKKINKNKQKKTRKINRK
jgi:hypothetical protein